MALYKNKNAIFPHTGLLIGDSRAGMPAPRAGCGRTPVQPGRPGQERAGRRGSGAGAGLCAGGGGEARPALTPAPLSKTHGKIYDPACEGAEGLSPPLGPGSGCPDSRIVSSAPLRASPRRQPRPEPPLREALWPSASLLRGAPRCSSFPRSLGSKGHRLRPVRFPAAAALEIRKQRALFVKCLTAEFIKA